MDDSHPHGRPRFYFALPRLLLKLSGGNAAPTDTNWLETNIAGTLMHLVAFVFGAHLLLSGLQLWQQLLLLVPFAILFWLFWMAFFQLGMLLVKGLHALGAFRSWADARTQGLLAGVMITAFALELVRAGGWLRVLGLTWLVAVSLNVVATLLLALSHADHRSAE